MTNTFKSNNQSKFVPAGNLIEGFTVIPNGIMNNISNMQPATFTVFAKILQYISNPNHKISIQGLSTQTGMSKDRVSKSIKELMSIGYIVRTPIKNGNLTNGYVYEVYHEPQCGIVGNTGVHRNPEIQDTETQDTGTQYANKENNNKKNKNKKNKEVVDEKEQQLLEMYKAFKLEKRFMPHTKRLLLEYKDSFDLEVFEQVFIYASSEKVTHKYKYLKDTFNKLRDKNITTLEQYENDVKEFKASKTKSKKKANTNGSNIPKVKTRFHNINESFRNYAPDELVEVIKESQKDKFKTKKECQIDKKELREKAIDILQERIDSDNTIMFKPNVRLDLNAFEDEINEICNELIQQL